MSKSGKMNTTTTSLYNQSTRPNTANNKSITDIIKKADKKT